MSPASGDELSGVLQAAQDGDPRAAAQLLPLVYADLRRLARARLARQAPGQTLQPTAAGQGKVKSAGCPRTAGAPLFSPRDIRTSAASADRLLLRP
jgi:hypothetical protein